jgi:membrane protease YdiL (CAAX protease family)
MSNRFSLWSFLAVLVALAGPFVVAVVGTSGVEGSWSFASHALSVAAIALTVIAVYAFSIVVDGCGFRDLGFAQVSWSSIAIGFVPAGFFIGIFGPLASWSLAQFGAVGFERGLSRIADLPTWYLILTIMVVAWAEELLYRAYFVERLGTLIGSRWIAGFTSLVMFCLAHVPMWGWAPALTTIAAGCIFTTVYLVRADVVVPRDCARGHRPVRARHRSPSGEVSGGRNGQDYDDSALNRRIGASRPRFEPCDRSELSLYSL